jgi:hypothetical protein
MRPGTRVRVLSSHGSPAFRGDVGVIEKLIPLNKAYVELEANGRHVVDLDDVEPADSGRRDNTPDKGTP